MGRRFHDLRLRGKTDLTRINTRVVFFSIIENGTLTSKAFLMDLEVYREEKLTQVCDACGVTVGEARYANEGEAEGGLGALLRFYAATQGVALPLSPAGWYYTHAYRGVWSARERADSRESAEERLLTALRAQPSLKPRD